VPELPEVPGVPVPTALPQAPGAPSTPPDGTGPLCPPVCTGSYAAYRRADGGGLPPGVDPALAELMLKGMQP
jgi:phospholipid/cholesterol/gamma-HCH transport system substrate-binding protein